MACPRAGWAVRNATARLVGAVHRHSCCAVTGTGRAAARVWAAPAHTARPPVLGWSRRPSCRGASTTAPDEGEEAAAEAPATTYSGGVRYYSFSGDAGAPQYPSVTSVLGVLDKPGLKDWAIDLSTETFKSHVAKALSHDKAAHLDDAWLTNAKRIASEAPDAVARKAARYGTRLHERIDTLVHGGTLGEVADDERPVVEGFQTWLQGSGLVLDARGDTVVKSDKYQYAGALDALARREADGALVVLDFKTSNSVHDSYAMQLAAYAHAVEEMALCGSGDASRVAEARVVRFDKKTGRVFDHRVCDLRVAFDGFKAALLLWRLNQMRLLEPTSR